MIDNISYSTQMRKKFSDSKMLNSDNSINQKYFNTKFGEYWNEDLYQILEKFISDNKLNIQNDQDFLTIKNSFDNVSLNELVLRVKILQKRNEKHNKII